MEKFYDLIPATIDDLEFVKDAKITTIFDYAKNISDEEREDIISYVGRFAKKFLNDYKVIFKGNTKCSVVLFREYEDGVLLDEIYIKEEFRSLGIGSSIIKNELAKHKKVYLWVYKENVKAVNLYKRLGFNVLEDENERYFMIYERK